MRSVYTALLGVDGTIHGRRERAAFFSRNAATPMMVIAVGSGDRVLRVLRELGDLLRRPLLTLEQVRICKRDGQLLAEPSVARQGRQRDARVAQAHDLHLRGGALHDGQPVNRAIVRRLREAGMNGATTQRGIWGFHGDHAPHGDRLFQLGRRVSALTIVVDSPERIAAAFAIVDELTAETGLVTSEWVPAVRPRKGAGDD
jgi:PII-like signaling protein